MAQANNILGPILLHAPRMQQFFRLLWNLSGETVPHGGILSGSLSKSTLTFRKNIGIIRLESASCVLLRTSRCPAGKSSFFAPARRRKQTMERIFAMIYTTEVQHMCPVAKGAYHGPAPIPEEGKWVQAKEISDISGFTHGVGWCAPQQGACKAHPQREKRRH